MAYVRKRTTKAGSPSTTLVEAYRDRRGRPRQRVLANLHGEPDTLRALAKLACMHEVLSEQRMEEHAEPSKMGAGFVLVTERSLTEYNHHWCKSTAGSPSSNEIWRSSASTCHP